MNSCRVCSRAPEWEPRIAGLTADLAFEAQGSSFLADTLVAHSSSHALDEGLARYLNDPSLKEGWAYDSDGRPVVAYFSPLP